jgi:molybdopterin-guanine dinucleotide biosynthesis protein A
VVVQAPGLDVVAFVVAGGRSARMGRDKALLPWEGQTLLDHALHRLRAITRDVRILCGPEPRYADHGVPLVPDLPADEGGGALAGVHAGLEAQGERLGLFLAVDLPHVTPDLLAALVEAAADADAAVPVTARGPEPLCAAYGPACREPARRLIAAGNPKLTGFWPEVRVRELGSKDLARFGDPGRLFANLNTPDDYARRRSD